VPELKVALTNDHAEGLQLAREHLQIYLGLPNYLNSLRTLGFGVFWPSWVLCSVPLPGLDRYVPTRPAHLL